MTQWKAASALVNLGQQYPQLKADADKLGQEYNELDNAALKLAMLPMRLRLLGTRRPTRRLRPRLT